MRHYLSPSFFPRKASITVYLNRQGIGVTTLGESGGWSIPSMAPSAGRQDGPQPAVTPRLSATSTAPIAPTATFTSRDTPRPLAAVRPTPESRPIPAPAKVSETGPSPPPAVIGQHRKCSAFVYTVNDPKRAIKVELLAGGASVAANNLVCGAEKKRAGTEFRPGISKPPRMVR